ncbi:MAG: hypothetical protein AB1689_14975 [Thermodesulfobacteriota bacterium]
MPMGAEDDDGRLPADEAGRRPLKPRFSSTFHTHVELWNAALHYQQLRRDGTPGGKQLDLAALLFAHLAVEAYANYLGQRIAPKDWEDERERFKTGGAVAKLEQLARLCDLPADKGHRPVQTLCHLQRLRNQLAHGRPETASGAGPLSDDDRDFLRSSISRAVSPESADRALEDVKVFVEQLHAAAKAKFPGRYLLPDGLGSITAEATIVGGH